MKELYWKIKFLFWYLKFNGHKKMKNHLYWVDYCYHENHSGQCSVLSPRDAAAEIINWYTK